MSEVTKIWFDKKGVGHAFDDEYSVTIHHDTAEEMERTARFLKYRAFWRLVAEAPEKDGYYLVTAVGRYTGGPIVAISEYENGGWSEGEAVLAWAPLPEPYEGKGKVC